MQRIYNPKFTDIHLAISQLGPYKVLPSIKEFGVRSSFSSSSPPPPFQTVGGLREPTTAFAHSHLFA